MTEQNKPEVQKNPNSEVTNPSEVRFRAVVDGFSDPILMLDEYRIVRYANHEFLRFFGYQLADVIGVPIEQLLPVDDRQEFVEHFETGLPTEARKFIFEHHLLRRDNGQEIVETTVNPLNDPTGQGTFLLHIHVITERKHAENELRELNTELEQRVASRTHELHQSNLELQHANRAKDEFLAMMSHELRTPLNSILGLSEILLDEMRGPLGDYQRRALQTIEASGQHLLQLINDILDLSKIEAGQSEFFPQSVEVDEICSASLAFVKAQALKKFIEVIYLNEAAVTHILADARRLKQILVNLLTNAVKFTPENGSVTLKVQTDLERNLIQFAVIDTGIGIAPENQKKLFQPFIQLDSSLSRQFEGTGLGLALVQKLTELHGGSIHVESEVGKGSCFTINLRCTEERLESSDTAHPESQSPAHDEESEDLSPSSIMQAGVILLAEDTSSNILTIGDYLENHHYTVIVAHNGVEALEQAAQTQPDLILMDIQMPLMDGLETTRRLRADPRFTSTPIIALTALAMPGDRERCVEAGANEYMSKPVKLKKLVQLIRSLLQQDGTD